MTLGPISVLLVSLAIVLALAGEGSGVSVLPLIPAFINEILRWWANRPESA